MLRKKKIIFAALLRNNSSYEKNCRPLSCAAALTRAARAGSAEIHLPGGGRNTNNYLVTNTQVGVQIIIMRNSTTGNPVYAERHVSSTNANGLLTLTIGGGNVVLGTFGAIDWSDGTYYMEVGIDPNGGSDYSIWSTQQLLSVPYALYANEAGNSFSGDYNDLTNTPTIPTVPANISAFTNDAGYITMDSVPAIPANVSAFNNDAGYITMDSIPAIPTVPTNVSAFSNDAGYLTNYTETDPTVPAWAKEATKPAYDYSEIANTPTIPTVPTNVSAFTNDAGYLTGYTESQNLADVTAQGNSAGNRQLKDVADPTESYDAVNLRSLTLMIDSAKNTMQQMQQQWLQAQQQWQETQQQWQLQQQQMQQQWQLQQTQLQQQIDSLTLILNSITADTAFSLWNTAVVNETACNAYEWHGYTYTQSGVYLYGFTNTDGSHNIEALNLTVFNPDTIHIQKDACDSYTWNGTTYTESGDYYLSLTNQHGCDSLQILHLTLHHGTRNVEIDTACDN